MKTPKIDTSGTERAQRAVAEAQAAAWQDAPARHGTPPGELTRIGHQLERGCHVEPQHEAGRCQGARAGRF